MPVDPHILRALLNELLGLVPAPPGRPGRWPSAALSSTQPSQPTEPRQSPDTLPVKLPEVWSNVLEAMADGVHRTARQIAVVAGYRLTNHFRGHLAAMRRAGLLHHDDAGYFLPPAR